MTRGRFITLEGVEGVGKSTNLAFMASFLEAEGIPVLVTREPGGTPLAEEVRNLLLAVREEPVDALTEVLLVFAGRAQHLRQQIEPALAAGHWVLCDRFTDATYAYQGGGRGLGFAPIAALERLVHPDLAPDLTLFLDLPWSVARERLADRDLDRFEQEEAAFFGRVRDAYRLRAARFPRFRIIDAAGDLPAVQAAIGATLKEFIERVRR